MLRTNSKEARTNIRWYILNLFTPENYNTNDSVCNYDFENAARFIYNVFKREKYPDNRRIPEKTLFIEWCAGLPSVLATDDYYLNSAVNVLGVLLDETENEKSKYTELQAEELLSSLIYREITSILSK